MNLTEAMWYKLDDLVLQPTRVSCLLTYAVCCFLQVYLAMWQETPVAVKVLMNTGVDAFNEEAVQPAITLSNPLLANLQKVRLSEEEKPGLKTDQHCLDFSMRQMNNCCIVGGSDPRCVYKASAICLLVVQSTS